MSAPMPRDSANQFVEVRAERFEGAPFGRRRRWSEEFKERAVAAALEPGVNISALARSLDISSSQLFGWRRVAARETSEGKPRPAAETTAGRARRVEIEIGGALVRVSADIEEEDLRRLLRAVRQA